MEGAREELKQELLDLGPRGRGRAYPKGLMKNSCRIPSRGDGRGEARRGRNGVGNEISYAGAIAG